MPAFVQTSFDDVGSTTARGGFAPTPSEGQSDRVAKQSTVNEFRAESTAKQLADRLEIVDPVAHRFDGHQDRHPE